MEAEDDEYWPVVGRQPIDGRLLKNVRRWEDLPSLALLNIFCRTYFKDRLTTIPLICRSWRSALEHPDCWSSMLPYNNGVSVEDAFIKNCNLFPTELELHQQDFETLIKRSGGGSSITSLFLRPFFIRPRFCSYDHNGVKSPDEDAQYRYDYRKKKYATESQVFHLIANSCPNLKHISFHGFEFYFEGMKEDLLEIFRKCKMLELVDFSCSKQLDSPDVIQEMGNHLPLLRGIRILGPRKYDVANCIATYLPRLQLLNLGLEPTFAYRRCSNLSTILSSCVDLEYLNVSAINKWWCKHPEEYLHEKVIEEASSRIPEFYWCSCQEYEEITGKSRAWGPVFSTMCCYECLVYEDYMKRKSENVDDRDENECYDNEDYLCEDDIESALVKVRPKKPKRAKDRMRIRRRRCK